MLLRGDSIGARPVSTIEASKPTASVTDARQDVVRQLTQLAVGRVMQGTVLSQMDDGSFIVKIEEADVAVRMNLPAGSQVGDKLELTLETTQPRPTFSFSKPNQSEASLSQAGRLIDAALRTAQKEGAPTALVGKVPLLPSASAPPAQIASALKDTLAFSGLFYESHVQQWASGERPLNQLMREPQARYSNQTLIAASLLRAASTPAQAMENHTALPGSATVHASATPLLPGSDPAAVGTKPMMTAEAAALARASLPPDAASLSEGASPADTPDAAQVQQPVADSSAEETPQAATSTSQNTSAATVSNDKSPAIAQFLSGNQPEGDTQATGKPGLHAPSVDINPQRNPAVDSETARMISLQLDTLEQRRVAWQGELWPGQYMEWEVTEDSPHQASVEVERSWQSVVRFELPRLGNISAAIHLSGQSVQVQVRAASEDTASLLRTHAGDLASALDAAGSRLDGFTVKRDESA